MEERWWRGSPRISHMPASRLAASAARRRRRGRRRTLDLRVEVAELLAVEVDRVQQLAVDVELGLVPGAVADAHRARVAPAAQVRKLALGQVVLAADPVHDLKRALARPAAGRARHERDELLGLVGAGADVERLERQARVADPGEAVVPVALAADRLGQRRRRRGDDRARRPVGEALEHARAEAARARGAGRRRRRARPPRSARPRPCPRFASATPPAGRGLGRIALLGRRPAQREADPLTRRDRERGAHRRVLDLGGHGRSAPRPGSGRRRCARRRLVRGRAADEAVLGPRRELHHAARPRRRPPRRRAAARAARRAEVVAALALGEGHRVRRRTLPVSVVNVVSSTSVPGR